MYPYMQFMNPFPYQRNEMQPYSYPRPSYEPVPPHMKPYSDVSPVYHTPWPSCGMNGYPYPHLQPYGCCNPNFFPAYGPMSAPCAHPPAHCCGGYSAHPGVHPCHLATPCWSVGPPQFEYQKDAPRFQHCVGCPNDTCKGGKNVKTEDLGPQAEPKGDVSLVPSSVKDCPYPVVWFPPNYLKGNMGGKESEPMCHKQEDAPSSTKSREMLKSSEHQPSFLNGWLPIDISKLIPKQEDDDSGRKLHNEDEKPYFPFPFFYVPGKADEMGKTDQKDADVGQQCPGRASSGLKADHFLSPELNDSTGTKSNEKIVVCQDPRVSEEKNENDVAPMKQGEKNDGKKMAQTTKEGNGTSLKHVSNEEKKLTENRKKRSPSPPKSSKLPPVCLRVDPLPKKKNGNGISKPSSPCGDKDEPFGSSKENIKAPVSAEASSEDESSRNKMQEQTASQDRPKRITKTIKVYDATSQPAEDISNTNCGSGVEGKPAHPAPVEESNRTVPEGKADHSEELPRAGNLKEPKKRELSEDEAAKIIQSTYRGYEVRKWEPLKKLRNIKTVQDEASQLKKRVEGLKSSPDAAVLDKSRTVIGETIMNLLLKLDSIQGLPASVRQFRKSVASDLVSLQAELDALVQCQTEKTEKSIPSASVTKSDGEVETGDHSCIQEGQENGKLSQKVDQADTDPARSESCLAQPCQGEGDVFDDFMADSKSVDAQELEIEHKDKREIHEEPPLIEISVEDENEVHKEEIPEVIDRYTMQLNDLWQNGNEALKGKSESNAFSGTELVDSVLPQSILDNQDSGMSVQPGKAEDVIQDVGKSNFIPKMGQAEQQGQLPLKANDLMDLGEIEVDENIDDCLSWLVPGLPDSKVQASGDLAVEGDEVDEFGTSANANALSENPLSEATSFCEVQEDMQDFSLAENEKARLESDDPVAEVCKGCEEMQDLMQSGEVVCVTQEQSAITDSADTVSCEDTSIAVNGKHDIQDLCQEEHEQKHPDEQLGVQASHLAIEDDNMVAYNPKQAGSEGHPEKDMVSVISIPKRTDGELSPPHSPASSQVSLGSLGSADNERNVIEENERLREMMQKLIQEGQEQLSAISSLSGKVKDLEKKLSRKKKVRLSRSNGSRAAPGNSCLKLSHRPIREKLLE